MMSYEEIIEEFPRELQYPMMKMTGKLREEFLNSITKNDLQQITNSLSILAQNIYDLSESQKKTEETLNRLAKAQEKSEERMSEVKESLNRLSKAQEKSEERMRNLEESLNRLAKSQEKTEEAFRKMIKRQDKMDKELGGLTHSFGYFLENEAINRLPAILKKNRGIDIEIMDRRFIVYADGLDDEINIYGEGFLEGKKIYVIGESKSQLGRKDVNRFEYVIRRVSNHLGAELYPVFVTHSVRPEIEAYAKEKIKGLEIFKSYQIK